MSDYRLACQTITWGETQRHHFPEVLREVAAAGFSGVEIGFRHLTETTPTAFRDLLGEHGLVMAATHVGGNLLDRGQAAEERALLDRVLDLLDALGASLLMYSGLTYQDDAQLSRDLEQLNTAARRCRERGVRLLYHNHHWEFADGARAMQAILTQGAPELGLCPDLGWLSRAGVDPAAFLQAHADRIGAVHFKDFAGPGPEVDTVPLGEGIVPLRAAADWLREQAKDLWIIAEQDVAVMPPAEAARRNQAFLAETLQR